jgi:hypothetical protein
MRYSLELVLNTQPVLVAIEMYLIAMCIVLPKNEGDCLVLGWICFVELTPGVDCCFD